MQYYEVYENNADDYKCDRSKFLPIGEHCVWGEYAESHNRSLIFLQ